jgi:perosamine synthetase
MGFFETDSHPVAEHLGMKGFYLPSGIGITDDDIDTSAMSLREVIQHAI